MNYFDNTDNTFKILPDEVIHKNIILIFEISAVLYFACDELKL